MSASSSETDCKIVVNIEVVVGIEVVLTGTVAIVVDLTG